MIKPNLSDESVKAVASSRPEVALAKGVLVQARQDLRRFRNAQDGLGREIYADAYGWIASNDLWWPYSFLNVCELLGLTPEALRGELLSNPQPGWAYRSRRVAQRISTSLRGSLANVFVTRRRVASSHHSNRPVLAH
jgi:hypothetical protein